MTTSEDYRLYLDAKFSALHDKLDEIKNIVADHDVIIKRNLPHNISLCPQRETIKMLEENMVSNNAIKKSIIVGVSVIVSLITIIFGIVEIFL